jgi:hypothetical protein
MIKGFLFTFCLIFLFSGCSQYKDPELAKKIKALESKEKLDEFDKEELRDLKEQAKYDTHSMGSCKTP